jgi:hypothetical protein
MKSPHKQRPDDQARKDTEGFIAKYAGLPSAKAGSAAKARAKRPVAKRSKA